MVMFGGLALVLLGTGMILTSPAIRKYLGGLNVGNLLANRRARFRTLSEIEGNVSDCFPRRLTFTRSIPA